MDVGSKARVVGQVPARVFRVFVDYYVVAVPPPIIHVAVIVTCHTEIRTVKPEPVPVSTRQAVDVFSANTETKTPSLPRVVAAIVPVFTVIIVTNPFVIVMDMWRVWMANTVVESAAFRVNSAIVGTAPIITALLGILPVLPILLVYLILGNLLLVLPLLLLHLLLLLLHLLLGLCLLLWLLRPLLLALLPAGSTVLSPLLRLGGLSRLLSLLWSLGNYAHLRLLRSNGRGALSGNVATAEASVAILVSSARLFLRQRGHGKHERKCEQRYGTFHTVRDATCCPLDYRRAR